MIVDMDEVLKKIQNSEESYVEYAKRNRYIFTINEDEGVKIKYYPSGKREEIIDGKVTKVYYEDSY